MDLQCRVDLAARYKAASQIARVLSEDWCARELYCPACDSNRLTGSKPNNPAVDFECGKCDQPFQLKSLRHWNPRKVVDAGYEAMLRAIRADRTPNLLLLQYSNTWEVQNLLLVPRMFFTESVVEKRFSRVRQLAQLPPSLRGWTLDVLRVVRELGKSEFSLQELYAFEPTLKTLHPKNQNVRPKIRQQLQVLRDLGLLRFGAKGNYNVV